MPRSTITSWTGVIAWASFPPGSATWKAWICGLPWLAAPMGSSPWGPPRGSTPTTTTRSPRGRGGGWGVRGVRARGPALVLGRAREWEQSYQFALEAMSTSGLPLNLVTYFDDLGAAYSWAVQHPVAILSLA